MVCHMEYKSFSREKINGQTLYDTFSNYYNSILYSDFTLLHNFSYKILKGKKYVTGDWGIWTRKGDTIITQYLNDGRDKFNKNFYVRGEVLLAVKGIPFDKIKSFNLLNPQPEGK